MNKTGSDCLYAQYFKEKSSVSKIDLIDINSYWPYMLFSLK